ncbi:hypothetical protein Cgig2_030005 [Carnegiea gigantea]|uniref:Retrotransposon Copia-like N-terminal domain-containing protein n=1 Tax=Carnegiea gigantea TaxID=171969 RepID=A0A9Q1K7U2_9CARY|nr:hypothetical protein Cgig2_030005 [Carnegiea gigantea]
MSVERGRVNYPELHNSLFIHPFDGPGSLSVGEKLNGARNYGTWRHSMEIGLSTKYKLGSRKYKLIKDVYSFKQDDSTVSEYYTMLRGVWKELDAMNELPRITAMADDITNFLNFLNGLDDKYQSLRSQILIMTPLLTVDMACGMIQQEEMQREVLNQGNQVQYEVSALYSRGNDDKCGVCGNKGHSKDNCWQVIGYPRWHPRSKRFPQKKSVGKEITTEQLLSVRMTTVQEKSVLD